MNTGQSTPQTTTLERDMGRIAGQLMAMSLRYPDAASDLGFLLDILETIIAAQPAPTMASPAIVVRFPERRR